MVLHQLHHLRQVHSHPPHLTTELTPQHESLRNWCFSQHWLLRLSQASWLVRLSQRPTWTPPHTCFVYSAKGARITFLLRTPAVLESDEVIRPYIQSGHAKLVKGDALIAGDVARGWAVAQEDGSRQVDVVLFTLGKLELCPSRDIPPHSTLSSAKVACLI